MFWKIIIVAFVVFSWFSSYKEIIIQTKLGKITGIIQFSRKGNRYFSFRGIRYAEPPTGENRFRLAIPVKSWKGEMDATKDGFICPQPMVSKSLMSENCLILNIYTKSLKEGLLPVIFYVHGGYFAIGGSHSDLLWNPRYLMDKDIVLVTFNYRLGPLGFLSTGSMDVPDNLGLKDQVLALQWVRENIRLFGGDSSKVTLLGHSGGSFMVTLHMVSPMSQGLFQQVIAMSGSATSHIRSQNRNTTQNIARHFQCPLNDPKLLVQCLRNIPWEKLIEIIPDLFDWSCEVEKDLGQEIFMPTEPSILFAQGKFTRVPILAGITKDEFEPDAYVQLHQSNIIDELSNDFYKKAPEVLNYDPKLTSITKTLRYAYLKNKPITKRNLKAYGQLYSDAIIGHGVHRFITLTRRYTDVFYYRQDFQGRYSWEYNLDGKPYGIFHGDDLLFVFVYTEKAPLLKETDPENLMIETVTTLWTTFAQTGNPNNRSNPWTAKIRWKSTNKNRVRMLYMNKRTFLGYEPYQKQKRMKLWDNLFPIFSKL